MALHDGMILLLVGAAVVYGLGRSLIWAFFAAKRRNQQRLLRDLYNEELS